MHAMVPRALVILTVLAVILGGCGSGGTETTAADDTEAAPAAAPSEERSEEMVAADEHGDETEEHTDEADEHASETFAFGEPADPADADRTVAIEATDEMAFNPETIDARVGEVITFEVTNAGQIPHDFTLGDEEAQAEHEREMQEMGADMAHGDANAMTVEPGETGSITWRFTEAGVVLYGCHQPGHYDAGMFGTIDVAS